MKDAFAGEDRGRQQLGGDRRQRVVLQRLGQVGVERQRAQVVVTEVVQVVLAKE